MYKNIKGKFSYWIYILRWKILHRIIGENVSRVFKASFNRDNLYYEVRPKVDIDKEIIKILANNKGKSGIVYCLSRKKVEDKIYKLNTSGAFARFDAYTDRLDRMEAEVEINRAVEDKALEAKFRELEQQNKVNSALSALKEKLKNED